MPNMEKIGPMNSATFIRNKREDLLEKAMNAFSNLLDVLKAESFKVGTEGELYANVFQYEEAQKLSQICQTGFWVKYCKEEFKNRIAKLGWEYNTNFGIIRLLNVSEDNE